MVRDLERGCFLRAPVKILSPTDASPWEIKHTPFSHPNHFALKLGGCWIAQETGPPCASVQPNWPVCKSSRELQRSSFCESSLWWYSCLQIASASVNSSCLHFCKWLPISALVRLPRRAWNDSFSLSFMLCLGWIPCFFTFPQEKFHNLKVVRCGLRKVDLQEWDDFRQTDCKAIRL